jgi:PLP dependent protein
MAGTNVAANLRKIRKNIPESVTLVAVSKFHSTELVRAAADEGINNFGENYVQEALEKMHELSDLKINWHFIGGIQSNKLKSVAGKFTLIQSVDDLSHVKKISQLKTTQDILIQVNVGNEKTKSGVSFENLVSFYENARKEAGVRVKGLMCLPPLEAEISQKKKYFKQMKKFFDELKLEVLSMGTSHDYLTAIDEGSNMVRIGTEIFGERVQK